MPEKIEPSIAWSNLIKIAPNGTRVRFKIVELIDGIVLWPSQDVDTRDGETIEGRNFIPIQAACRIDPVAERIRRVEFHVDDEWITFDQLCNRARQQKGGI
jgi:hypothetical protein